jgi:SAM-dependent methyltransferase
MQNILEKFIGKAIESFENKDFVKMTLSKNVSAEADLKNIFIKPVTIKNNQKLSFTYRYKTKDIVKNYTKIETEIKLLEYINVNYFTIVNLISVIETNQLIIDKNGKIKINSSNSSKEVNISNNHNNEKVRKIDSKGKYLFDLKITDVNGVVFKTTQDKFKQINHYIELIAPLLKDIPKYDQLNVVDMGSGKGYLTFALYDYLNNVVNINSKVTGVEFRKDLVDLCNKISTDSYFSNLNFEEGTIADYAEEKIDILIALHACDTATDDAIFKGIKANASLIVVAPCCHKQIRREIEKGKAKNELDFLTAHGIFMERQAEMVTDGLRALLLEYSGYTVKIQQFISDAHTPKNVMITAIKKEKLEIRNGKLELKGKRILEKIKEIKTFFGIEKHHLELLLGL